jgi:hypothetical protein
LTHAKTSISTKTKIIKRKTTAKLAVILKLNESYSYLIHISRLSGKLLLLSSKEAAELS